jgi:hypothetical protein
VCGQYFTRGPARRKLDRFLPCFQRYLLAKPPLPLDVEFDVQVGGWGGKGGGGGGFKQGRSRVQTVQVMFRAGEVLQKQGKCQVNTS